MEELKHLFCICRLKPLAGILSLRGTCSAQRSIYFQLVFMLLLNEFLPIYSHFFPFAIAVCVYLYFLWLRQTFMGQSVRQSVRQVVIHPVSHFSHAQRADFTALGVAFFSPLTALVNPLVPVLC